MRASTHTVSGLATSTTTRANALAMKVTRSVVVKSMKLNRSHTDGSSRRNARTSRLPTGRRSKSTNTNAAVEAAQSASSVSKNSTPQAPSVNAGHHTTTAMPTEITASGMSRRRPSAMSGAVESVMARP